MSDFTEDEEFVLHTLNCKLYESHFEGQEGKYYARTMHNKTLGVADVVSSAKTRTKYHGEKALMTDHIIRYIKERNFLLADGYVIDEEGYVTWYSHIGGMFDSAHAPIDPEKNKVEIKHISGRRLKNLAKKIKIEVLEVAHPAGDLDYLQDAEDKTVPHNLFILGNMVSIHGAMIRIMGDHPDVGVYFVPVDNPAARVKMTRISVNEANRIVGIPPDSGYRHSRIEIVTQYHGSGASFLKEPRVLTSKFTVECP